MPQHLSQHNVLNALQELHLLREHQFVKIAHLGLVAQNVSLDKSKMPMVHAQLAWLVRTRLVLLVLIVMLATTLLIVLRNVRCAQLDLTLRPQLQRAAFFVSAAHTLRLLVQFLPQLVWFVGLAPTP